MSEKHRVLVVDDDKLTLRLSVHIFERGGYEVFTAPNGVEALAKVHEIKPDVIVLDVMMPDMSGLEVCQRLRANPATAWLPIIMLSAKGQVDDKLSGFQAGADDYVQKPVAPKELLARVAALLQRSRRNQPQDGRIISVVGTKGGVGVTTIVVNVATSLVNQGKSVVIAELRTNRGTVAHNLNMRPSQDLSSLIALDPVQLDYPTVTRRIVQHPSGLRILVAPQQPVNNHLTAAHVKAIVKVLSLEADVVILDLPAVAGEEIHQALDMSDQILLVTDPEPVSITCTQADIETLKTWGVFDLTSLVVISRARSSTMLSPSQIEKELKIPIMSVLPPSPETFYLAASVGKPLVSSKPDALAASQLEKLAKKVAEQFLAPIEVPA